MNKSKTAAWGPTLFLLGVFLIIPFNIAAQVDQAELEKTLGPVEFINYEGPYDKIDTRDQIRDIGYGLGSAVRAGNASAGGQGRYFVIHSMTEPEGGKLDADIFGLGGDVGVDHIRNLRLIIQGYLEAAYGYSGQDAALLANYITIYNAVYRGDWDYFLGRYKDPVMKNQTREKAGLSIRFDEWPGRTLMFVPLGTGEPGSISAVDIMKESCGSLGRRWGFLLRRRVDRYSASTNSYSASTDSYSASTNSYSTSTNSYSTSTDFYSTSS